MNNVNLSNADGGHEERAILHGSDVFEPRAIRELVYCRHIRRKRRSREGGESGKILHSGGEFDGRWMIEALI